MSGRWCVRMAHGAILVVVALGLFGCSARRLPVTLPKSCEFVTHHLSADDRIVLLHFWSSWCPMCKPELEELRDFSVRAAAHGISVVSVAIFEERQHVDRYLATVALPFPTLIDEEGRCAREFGIESPPATVFLSSNGAILSLVDPHSDARVARLDGPRSWRSVEMQRALDTLQALPHSEGDKKR